MRKGTLCTQKYARFLRIYTKKLLYTAPPKTANASRLPGFRSMMQLRQQEQPGVDGGTYVQTSEFRSMATAKGYVHYNDDRNQHVSRDRRNPDCEKPSHGIFGFSISSYTHVTENFGWAEITVKDF